MVWTYVVIGGRKGARQTIAMVSHGHNNGLHSEFEFSFIWKGIEGYEVGNASIEWLQGLDFFSFSISLYDIFGGRQYTTSYIYILNGCNS